MGEKRARGLAFWGRNSIENLVLILLASLVLEAFFALKISPASGEGFLEAAASIFSMYPYYMFLTGGFLMLIAVASYVQTYIPVLVSFNCKRSMSIVGIMGSMTGTILGMTVVGATVCAVAPGGEEQWQVLPVLAGAAFLEMGIALIFGSAGLRWGRVGRIATALLMMVAGGMLGFGLAVGGEYLVEVMLDLCLHSLALVIVGVFFFLASGIFAMFAVSKLEVRA